MLSVGCGLDTRPWRLDLQENLRWIEIDFADVLDDSGNDFDMLIPPVPVEVFNRRRQFGDLCVLVILEVVKIRLNMLL